MAQQNEEPKKFRPERPVILNEQNTNFKTKIEVVHAVEKLRSLGWLCAYGEKARPFHMSFNDEKEFQEFKKAASKLDVKLQSPIVKDGDMEEMEDVIIAPEPTSSYEAPDGKVHIDSK